MMTISKVVLLDFDGVVFRNKKIKQVMYRNSTKYLAKSLCVKYDEAHYLQDVHLSTFGHTSKIESYIIQKPIEQCIMDYNQYVFKDKIDDLLSTITTDDVFHINNLLELKSENDLKYVLFSNAHLDWINIVCNNCDISRDDLFDDLYTSDNNPLKPNIEAYQIFDKIYPENKLFLDDNLSNLLPITNKKNWSYSFIKDVYRNAQLYDIILQNI